jgi:hypothetical protein
MNIYKVLCSTDLALVGAYPQVYTYAIKDHKRPYDNLWHLRDEQSKNFEISGSLSVDAKKTQLLSCVELSPGKGLLLENSVFALIGKYLPQSCILHPFTVADELHDKIYSYSFLEVGTTVEVIECIDYQKSKFYRNQFGEFHSDIEISSHADWELKQKAEVEQRSSLRILPKILVLNKDVFETCGVVQLPFDARIFFTEPVAKILLASTVSGLELVKEEGFLIK